MASSNRITATHTGLHAWAYETFVAPAVFRSRHVVDDSFLVHLPPGAHQFTNYIADQRPDVSIVGVDLSQPQIERASKRMSGYADRVSFQLGDATQLTFADRTFDGVVSYGSIKHWT